MLALSLTYNATWIFASRAILEMRCKAHFAEVTADAIARKQKADWTNAAHLYGYLLLYYPYSENGCAITSEEANWKLPFGALALKWRYRERAEQKSNRNKLELKGLRRAYSYAAEHASLDPSPPKRVATNPARPAR